MKIIVGGETSGRVRDAFRRLGHDAISCDFLPTDVPGPHYQGDYWDIAQDERWDLGIFHPTCTFMCNSGVRWLSGNEERWRKMRASAEDFKRLLSLPYPKAIENPIMHRYARDLIGRRPDQIVQPWMFGDRATKATCFWLDGLDPLQPTDSLGPPKAEEREKWAIVHRASPGPDRWKIRSITPKGLAKAMARQWGGEAKGIRASLVRLDFELGLTVQAFEEAARGA